MEWGVHLVQYCSEKPDGHSCPVESTFCSWPSKSSLDQLGNSWHKIWKKKTSKENENTWIKLRRYNYLFNTSTKIYVVQRYIWWRRQRLDFYAQKIQEYDGNQKKLYKVINCLMGREILIPFWLIIMWDCTVLKMHLTQKMYVICTWDWQQNLTYVWYVAPSTHKVNTHLLLCSTHNLLIKGTRSLTSVYK